MPQLSEIWQLALAALAGSGLTTVVFQWWVKNTLERAQKRRDDDAEQRRQRYKIQDEYQHALGRTVFWIIHGIEAHEKAEGKGYWNGELHKAFDAMESAENKAKALDREQLADLNDGK